MKDVLLDSGWDWGQIPFALPADIKELILAMLMSITSIKTDRLVWAGSAKGEFDVKSAYKLAVDINTTPSLSAGWI